MYCLPPIVALGLWSFQIGTVSVKNDGLIVVKYVHKMNGLEYYNREKEDWSDKEVQDIRTEYETNEMTISQIADIHNRTPGSISYKLKNIGLITHNTLSRGYLDYKNSNLYKQIVEVQKKAWGYIERLN